jgi:hypothetical protein
MQTMDADLARLVRNGTITRSLAQQRASVPEELKRLLGEAPLAASPVVAASGNGSEQPASPAAPVPTPAAASSPPPSYAPGG